MTQQVFLKANVIPTAFHLNYMNLDHDHQYAKNFVFLKIVSHKHVNVLILPEKMYHNVRFSQRYMYWKALKYIYLLNILFPVEDNIFIPKRKIKFWKFCDVLARHLKNGSNGQ